MRRVSLFIVAAVAALGLFGSVGAPTAGAIKIRGEVLEGTTTPEPGALLDLCLTIRPGGANCIQI